MLFNSTEFLLFFIVLFVIYWAKPKNVVRHQNLILLTASYFFYGWWDIRFLLLLIGISLFNYFIGKKIYLSDSNSAQKWLVAGLLINITVLAVFKYFNFFINGFVDLVAIFGYDLPRFSTKIIIPLGVSFYTFLSISYLIDIRRGAFMDKPKLEETLLSLSFFPIILAGPIQRPSSLIPQFSSIRVFDYGTAKESLRQILWGLFAKLAIADNLSGFVDGTFTGIPLERGSTLALGAILFAIQVYADFSGYSNISIGIARLLGFDLIRNFNYPYFSITIADFWKKWHISLTTWFRDYVFLPISFAISGWLKDSNTSLIKQEVKVYFFASLSTWFLTGLWHGANYTFLCWGMIHGIFLFLFQIQNKPRKRILKKLGVKHDNPLILALETCLTLVIVIISWIFFRASNLVDAFSYLSGLFSGSFFTLPVIPKNFTINIILVLIFLTMEFLGRKKSFALGCIESLPSSIRWLIYLLFLFIMFFFSGQIQNFIYFQF